MTDSEWSEFAWAVGVFEGEGCISLGYAVSKISGESLPRIALRLAMKDEDVVRRFHAAVGVGHIHVLQRKRLNPKHSDLWGWDARKREETVTLLNRLLPHLGERRRAKALEAIEADRISPKRKAPSVGWARDRSSPGNNSPTKQCGGIRHGSPCPQVATLSGLCRACYMRRYRGGFVDLVCKPWEKKRLLRATRMEARKVFR